MLLAFLGEIRTDQYYTIDNFPTILLMKYCMENIC